GACEAINAHHAVAHFIEGAVASGRQPVDLIQRLQQVRRGGDKAGVGYLLIIKLLGEAEADIGYFDARVVALGLNLDLVVLVVLSNLPRSRRSLELRHLSFLSPALRRAW